MATFSGRLLTDGIIAALTDAGLLVGDAIKPAGGGWSGVEGDSEFVSYTVVYPSPGGVFDGSLCDNDDGATDYIISSFGSTRRMAQLGNDKVFDTLATLPGDITVTGRHVMIAVPDVDGGVVRDDDVSPPIFYTPSRWRIMTTAAP